VFGAVKNKFSGVSFQELDLDDQSNQGVIQKYGVSGIPHVVFLDASGNVLFSGSPQRSEDAFAEQIQQFR
jgi:thioredoxin-related protein